MPVTCLRRDGSMPVARLLHDGYTISLQVPPISFGRISLRPLNILICIAATIVGLVVWAGGWLPRKDK